MLLNTYTEWGIDKDKVSAVVTDNAVSTVKAIDLAFGKKTHTMFRTRLEFGGTEFYSTVYSSVSHLKMDDFILTTENDERSTGRPSSNRRIVINGARASGRGANGAARELRCTH
ncbi:hypothetical protein EVAR_50559_1 [Eumeta japonica]|uniref:DUF659 domain-containing protein n=1 Tax=Eumeta variegata TaxID=151549 RepID=A0A4C2AE81_EUMVA|nr:hypothetical protein EVAR_50559_1 [Eumeta japonica]